MLRLFLVILLLAPWQLRAGEQAWYTQGNFKPVQRLEFTLVNTLDFDRVNAPVVITPEQVPGSRLARDVGHGGGSGPAALRWPF